MQEYEKLRMRQNPMLSSRAQAGGRPMPNWFSASLVNQSRATMSTPPPLPAEPPPTDESEYEEIDQFTRHRISKRTAGKRACSLCGNHNPVVSCEMCENQIFCGSCNDMYHRHPKRLHHIRKILESLDARPPLPPKTFLTQDNVIEASMSLPPIAPPRRNKRFGMKSATSSPTLTRKLSFDPMGTLKRFVGGMGQRPLPPPPKPAPPLPPKASEFGRPMTPVQRLQAGSTPNIERRFSSAQLSSMQNHQMAQRMHEMHQPRNQSISVVNINDHFVGGQDHGYPQWQEEDDFFARQRAHSISTPRFSNSANDASHFATLQRSKRGSKPPERPPPPVPPRSLSSSQSQLGFQSSQSAFNLNQMGMVPQFGIPWNYSMQQQGYPYDVQQAAMMGYPGTMRRTPSNSSMGGGFQQQFFGWPQPMGFGAPMSQQEMEQEILAARRGSEPPQAFFNQRSSSVSLSQPVTPQGSFRKKSRPPPFGEQRDAAFDEMKANERFIQNQQIKQRATTPSSFARVKPTPQARAMEPVQYQHQQQDHADEIHRSNAGIEITEEPEGPWTCEHCTFINPKSTNVCTICCKTPSDGYRCNAGVGLIRPSTSRKSSISDEIPVVNSKLSISRGKEQQTTINLVERVERITSPLGLQHRSRSQATSAKSSKVNETSKRIAQGEDEYEEYDDDNFNNQQRLAHHHITIGKTGFSSSQLCDSNEDVYGSVSLQAMTISPKIEIRRSGKTKSTGVGSSPPKASQEAIDKPSSPKSPPQLAKPTEKNVQQKSDELVSDKPKSSKLSPLNSSPARSSRSSDSNDNSVHARKSEGKAEVRDEPQGITRKKSTSVATTSTSTSSVQADSSEGSNNGSNGNGKSSNRENSSSSNSSSFDSVGKSPGPGGIKVEARSSKGTSPPPQSISTQTYEEIPASSLKKHSSKTSMNSMQSFQSEDYSPPKSIEMSEKALRYARKAHHNHQAKLKRSMSTHLPSATEPWVDAIDGRPLYRSSSRHSLLSDTRSLPLSGPPSRDGSPPPRSSSRFYEDFKRFQPTSWDRFPTSENYFASIDDLVSRRRRESTQSQELELTRLLKEAEEFNYSPEDVQVALRMCGERNPIKWLRENWSSMVETVQTLATKYGREKGSESNQVGTVSSTEAKEALRTHKGNVWAAVTECVDERRKKFLELQSRGTFLRDDILTALTANHGNLDAAYIELSKAQLKPFLMRIWGPPSGLDNDAVPPSLTSKTIEVEPEPTVKIINDKSSKKLEDLATDLLQSKVKLLSQECTSTPIDPNLEVAKKEAESLKESTLESNPYEDVNPKIELLVSNAEKVTQQIEMAIKELKLSSGKVENKSLEFVVPLLAQEISKIYSDISSPIKKNDEIEDESFADAVSDSDPNAASPNFELISPADFVEDYDEDILEIEIDDSEANISEFIQNYEVLPAKPPLVSTNGLEATEIQSSEPPQSLPAIDLKPQPQISEIEAKETLNDSQASSSVTVKAVQADEKNANRLSSSEIEQLLSTLTNTFTEMGQFATEIKEKIASEIQQQLAAVVNQVAVNSEATLSTINHPNKSEDSNPEDPLYEPVTLPESVLSNIDKKLAKYKRLAAKNQQKSTRHKSPDKRTVRKSSSKSPSPASSSAASSVQEIPKPTKSKSSTVSNKAQINPLATLSLQESATEGPANHDNSTNILHSYESVEVEMGKDEGEYESGSESEYSEEEEAESAAEEEDDDEISESEEIAESSSGEEPEVRKIFENDDNYNQDESYEEVEVSHSNSSEYDLYSNKDTDKTAMKNEKNNYPFVAVSTAATLTVEEPHEICINPNPIVEESQVPKTETELKLSRLLTDGKVGTAEKAELAMQLMDMNFAEDDSIYAANECFSLYSALSFLQQECDLCTGKFSARQMVSMLRCTHVCCHTCAKEYFTVQIRDKSIVDATCPFCTEPGNLTENTELATDYFNHLDILLKGLVEPKFHEMFQRKLRDWALAQTPNFKWCSKCSSGFITEPLQTRLICPDCNAVTCAICLEQWDKVNHDHRESKVKVCDSSSKSIVDYLNENCIECPRCHFRFSLARGGCMHLTCTQCRHEFCSGCSAPFKLGEKCEAKLPVCERLGLHAHHPRNCLFYLRDKEPDMLCKLLEESAIPYLKENSGEIAQGVSENSTAQPTRECQVPIQKETNEGLKDDICGKDAPLGFATVCKSHYVEYLGLLIWQNQLDPISILSSDDLEVIIRRACKKHPGRPYPTSDEEFRKRLLRVINEEIPL